MEILKRIKDNKRIGWICKLWSQPGSFLSISLNSSFESRFIVGSVEIKKKEKTAEIIDFKTKDDDADIFGLARDYSGIGLGSQIYDFLENHLKSIGIKKIYADIYYKDDKDGKASSFWKNRGYTLILVEKDDVKYKIHKELE